MFAQVVLHTIPQVLRSHGGLHLYKGILFPQLIHLPCVHRFKILLQDYIAVVAKVLVCTWVPAGYAYIFNFVYIDRPPLALFPLLYFVQYSHPFA